MVTDPDRWSAVGYQEHDRQFAPDSAISRAERLAGAGPYDAAVVPHIADAATLRVSRETLTLLTEAAGEISRFDTEASAEIARSRPFSCGQLHGGQER